MTTAKEGFFKPLQEHVPLIEAALVPLSTRTLAIREFEPEWEEYKEVIQSVKSLEIDGTTVNVRYTPDTVHPAHTLITIYSDGTHQDRDYVSLDDGFETLSRFLDDDRVRNREGFVQSIKVIEALVNNDASRIEVSNPPLHTENRVVMRADADHDLADQFNQFDHLKLGEKRMIPFEFEQTSDWNSDDSKLIYRADEFESNSQGILYLRNEELKRHVASVADLSPSPLYRHESIN
jgi:hypothetical protein